MIEIKPKDFQKYNLFFLKTNFQLEVSSILKNNTKGRVFVDSIGKTSVGVVWNLLDGFVVEGKGDEESLTKLNELIKRVIRDLKEIRFPVLTVVAPEVINPGKLEILFKDVKYQPTNRNYYIYNHMNNKFKPSIPGDFELQEMDKKFFAKRNMRNLELAEGWVLSFWRSIDDFLKMGYGYALVSGETITSWCLTVYAEGVRRELGMETHPDWRRRGLGKIVADACLKKGEHLGFVVEWNCDQQNIPSVKLAEGLGLVKAGDYFAYKIKI